MIQKDKELLLQDLCARLPYGVKVSIEYSKGKYTRIYDLREIDNNVTSDLRQQVTVWNYGFYSSVISYPLIDCRPYLRSLSSMTIEEFKEWLRYCKADYDCEFQPELTFNFESCILSINWLNQHHFDYNNLIEEGLAIAVTKENNPYK